MKLLLIAGARPNFMKVAPLIHAIERHNAAVSSQPATHNPRLSYRLVHTGQHYDEKMSDVFFAELGIPAPDVNLEVGSGSHASQTAEIMKRFEPVLLNAFPNPSSPRLGVRGEGQGEESSVASGSNLRTSTGSEGAPDWVIVVGDVNSTMACTLVASKLGIKVAHVEAGLRSFDRTMPEEINRLVTDALADLLLTPSEDGNENLRREGVAEKKIRLVGNIMIDALVQNLEKARRSPILKTLNLKAGQFVYVTLHRPNNVDRPESLSAIMAELRKLASQMTVVFPMHPRTRKMLSQFNISWNGAAGFNAIEPIGYYDSISLTENARLVLTDSGGLQEEATYFRTPCLTLRPNTERPVTVTLGSNRLTKIENLPADLRQVLDGEPKAGQVPPLWDGQTGNRILQALIAGSADRSLSNHGASSRTDQPQLAGASHA